MLQSATTPLQDKKQTILDSQLAKIESRLNGLVDVNLRISQAVARLLNPRPEACEKDPGQPVSPNTIEGRLTNVINMLDSLQKKFDENASDLDQAI